MTTADDLLKFSAGEEAEVEGQVKALAQSGVSVVVSGGKFGDLYLHFLNKYKIMAVRIMSKVGIAL
jgi:T-complex protein 1 subunit theta